MENWIYATAPLLLKVMISIIAIFTVMIIITRISGLRNFAKMSSFDFASTIAVGSILAAVVSNSEQSLLKGGVALAGIIAFQTLFSLLARRSTFFKKLATNDPLLLMRDGKILFDNLKKANEGETDLIAKLREANVINYTQVHAVILESKGDMSVLHGTADSSLNDDLLKGVAVQ